MGERRLRGRALARAAARVGAFFALGLVAATCTTTTGRNESLAGTTWSGTYSVAVTTGTPTSPTAGTMVLHYDNETTGYIDYTPTGASTYRETMSYQRGHGANVFSCSPPEDGIDMTTDLTSTSPSFYERYTFHGKLKGRSMNGTVDYSKMDAGTAGFSGSGTWSASR